MSNHNLAPSLLIEAVQVHLLTKWDPPFDFAMPHPGLSLSFCHPPPQQKEFVRQIQSSGVLVVLSQAWIEELYHQVLERNLLGEAGYWGSAEDHSLALITMLTGSRPSTQSAGAFDASP